MVGAEVVGVNSGTMLGQIGVNPRIKPMQVLFGLQTACNACLVSDDDDFESEAVRRSDGIYGPGDPLPVFDPVHMIFLDVESPVTIEEYGPSSHVGLGGPTIRQS
jgi:hypothetical protein